jgi:hypothetical protein
MGKYGKFVIGFLYACAMAAVPQLTGDGHLDPAEAVVVATGVVSAAGVWLLPLAPGATWTKSVYAFLMAALGVAATVILDFKIDANEWLMIATAALGAIGIGLAPASSETGARPVSVGWGSDNAVR